jgi:hypothetical protein
VKAKVDHDLTTVSWVDWLLGLIKNLGHHTLPLQTRGKLSDLVVFVGARVLEVWS